MNRNNCVFAVKIKDIREIPISVYDCIVKNIENYSETFCEIEFISQIKFDFTKVKFNKNTILEKEVLEELSLNHDYSMLILVKSNYEIYTYFKFMFSSEHVSIFYLENCLGEEVFRILNYVRTSRENFNKLYSILKEQNYFSDRTLKEKEYKKLDYIFFDYKYNIEFLNKYCKFYIRNNMELYYCYKICRRIVRKHKRKMFFVNFTEKIFRFFALRQM